jgi:ATP-dependent helicase/nuclease subunit B
MTKPSERLILCTRSKNVGGGSPTPSSAWTRVKYIFDYIEPKQFDYIKLLKAFKKKSGISERDTEDSVGSNDIANVSEDKECAVEIDPNYARLILGDRLRLSKSRIATFAECPYKYWCECVLKLRESKTTSIGYADAGTVIHYVLEKFVSKIRNDDGSLNRPSDEQVISLVEDILRDHITDINCPLPPSTMYSFSRLRDMTLIMVKSILDEFEDSSFKVVALEKPISDMGAGALKPMEIKVYDTEELPIVSLGGVIDRIDCYDDGVRKYIRIIDYKTGSHKYNVSKIESGEDLQLPAYLFTAVTYENRAFFGDGGEPFPAAALFLSADEQRGETIPVRSGFMLKDKDLLRAASGNADSKMLAGIKINDKDVISGNSAVPEEEIESLNATLQNAIANTARNMYSGKACRTPSETACAFCSLRASCPVANK